MTKTAVDAPEELPRMKCYIAGPMSDCHNFNFKSFEVAEEIVEDYGYEPVSPADITGVREGWDWSDYLRADLKLITDCDVIALLPGWQESKGASLEYRTARDLGLLVREVDLNSKVMVEKEVDDDSDPSILEEAQRIVYGPREADYGHPYDDYSRTAKLWEAILDVPVTPQQAALCMVAVKISREVNRPKRDNRVDMAGYAAVVDRIETHPDS